MQTVQAYSVQRKLDVKEQSSKIDQEYETTEHFYRQNRNNLETRWQENNLQYENRIMKNNQTSQQLPI